MDLVTIESLAMALWLKEVSPELWRKATRMLSLAREVRLSACKPVLRAVSANLRVITKALWGPGCTLRCCLDVGTLSTLSSTVRGSV